ncbi:MAG TPA: type II toxin-antitoxin system prevent-host-death family antitoxin [Methylobacterium sp.]|jgi:prevent-host-death family protein|uniref:type II toxin-antitoxin system Phd/YefM family antitoxin n=1 Tax=Methylorubrum sp. B1-46 TaxID=2897334 RepID=UPI001E57EBDB|nr:type II toxin-antitoxin system prevent-host-death family antitoxin [Methylorubrum sp. B1-46]UGB27497.1 type II toxin-antitoxin system prevent-host-death family antitoxin [Methylorubrum sp. B1-46]HEV2544029.1 type II toxin-antitoxin system prevent-host-death family antitoxin [Methylobacterium sp.]
MRVSVADAEDRLRDLVRRAQAGETIVLTREGQPVARIEPIQPAPDRRARRAVLDEARRSAAVTTLAGPDGGRSQDFLYGEDGLPL